MLKREQNKNEVNECKRLLTEINNRLNKAISESKESYEELDRKQLRKIRDENIETYLLIQKLEMVGLI